MYVQQLISITHKVCEVFDCSPSLEVRVVFLDISKAFDKVSHDGLLYKFKCNGINDDLLKLMESFYQTGTRELHYPNKPPSGTKLRLEFLKGLF